MYLHIGGKTTVPLNEVVMIVDLESGNHKEEPQDYLSLADWEERLVYVSKKGKKRSIVITKEKVFYSPISANTIVKRSGL